MCRAVMWELHDIDTMPGSAFGTGEVDDLDPDWLHTVADGPRFAFVSGDRDFLGEFSNYEGIMDGIGDWWARFRRQDCVVGSLRVGRSRAAHTPVAIRPTEHVRSIVEALPASNIAPSPAAPSAEPANRLNVKRENAFPRAAGWISLARVCKVVCSAANPAPTARSPRTKTPSGGVRTNAA